MNSRYGLWMVCVCGIGLAGCANWQNRATNGPGGATTIQNPLGGPPVVATAPGVAPGTTFNEPPPPVPPAPSDPGAVLAPLGSAPAPRLDLSEAGPAPSTAAPAAGEMYNMRGGPAKSTVPSSSKPASSGSSTLSKLATKAGTSGESTSAAPKSSGLSTVKRLQKASSSSDKMDNSELPTPKKEVQAQKIVEPEPRVTRKTEPDTTLIDTALMAQPVRKGAGADEKKEDNSKGPQSSIAPGKKPFEKNKALIYPVSNPAQDRPVDITRFS